MHTCTFFLLRQSNCFVYCVFPAVIDFGGATYDDERKSTVVNTRQYRGPEVVLELGWSFPSDVWGVACMVAEIHSGDLLFPTVQYYCTAILYCTVLSCTTVLLSCTTVLLYYLIPDERSKGL